MAFRMVGENWELKTKRYAAAPRLLSLEERRGDKDSRHKIVTFSVEIFSIFLKSF